jgi:hypothetical protein
VVDQFETVAREQLFGGREQDIDRLSAREAQGDATAANRVKEDVPLSDDPTATSDRAHPSSQQREDDALARVMRDVPRGALALSALTVGLLLLARLLFYGLVFLPRGMVS